MTPEMLQVFIPIVAILVVFGFPVALIFTLKWFKLKDKELQLETEVRKTSGQALEARVQRLHLAGRRVVRAPPHASKAACESRRPYGLGTALFQPGN